jgi:hypothetical protein
VFPGGINMFLKKQTTIDNYNEQRKIVYNLLCATVDDAKYEYLKAKWYLYRLEHNDPKLAYQIKKHKTVDLYRAAQERKLKEIIEFFNRGDYKKLYYNKSEDEVIAAFDREFIEEVIPNYIKTGKFYYKSFFMGK